MSRSSEVFLEQVRHFAGAGMPPKTIAAQLNIPLCRVYSLRKRVGLGAAKKPLPASVERQIIEAYAKMGRAKIARALNLTIGCVSAVLGETAFSSAWTRRQSVQAEQGAATPNDGRYENGD